MTVRGERNNNPGNIRVSAARWQGAAGADGGFVVFATPGDGLRAMAKVLRNFRRLHGINTLRGVVHRYAPPMENDTAGYLQRVCKGVGVGPDEPVNLNDAGLLGRLMREMISVECGRCIYSDKEIFEAIGRA